MSYKHILVAVDLSKSSEKVIEKAVLIAKGANAQLSLIFVDVDNVSNIGIANLEISTLPSVEEREKTLQDELQALADKTNYPVESTIVVMGNLAPKLIATVKQKDVDLLVCGHHHDLWSRLLSSVNKLVNSVETDLLIVYLEE
ncbi:universal stress protein [Psychromonas sp.]|uniref:universal stress protein n=1 Tax=Psychromonas sp. TaxID=1884585 RepID=UPI0035676F3B